MRQLREQAGLKVEQVAVALDVSFNSVRNWEAGRSEPHLNAAKMNKLIQLYQCTLTELEEAIAQTRSHAA